MGLKPLIYSQFGNPRGLLGLIAGAIMARRKSNLERNSWTLSLLGIEPEHAVLEVGFGPGEAIAEAASLATEGLVAGFEHSQQMLRKASRRNSKAIADGRVQLRKGSVGDPPDFGCAFDRVFAINCYRFWDDKPGGLRKLKSMMSPGAMLAITEQARMPGATDADSLAAGEAVVAEMRAAGFADVRLEINEMEPVAAVCAIGMNQ